MTTALLSNRTFLVDDELRQAADSLVHRAFDRPLDGLSVTINGQLVPLPTRLSELLVHVIERTAEGGATVIESLPEELTTTVAANTLGISRPTLMRLVAMGELPSKKVGTHTRLMTADVFKLKKARTAARQIAFEKLRALADEIGEI